MISADVLIDVRGCHNPQTWDFNGGYEIKEQELTEKIINGIKENGILRNFSLLGGEPLCPQNFEYALYIVKKVKELYPNIKIFTWTGDLLENIQSDYRKEILKYIDVLIDGPFILSQRDVTLYLRGSRNQRILKKNIDF